MLISGILNPQIQSLLARVRHTNTLVIADRGFPSWPGVETIDLSLTDDIPRVVDVLAAIQTNWTYGSVWMAREFREHATPQATETLERFLPLDRILWEPHVTFKLRVPYAIGLIRTGDSTPYANMILESA